MYIGTTGRLYRFPWYNPVRLSMEWLSLAYVVFIPFMYLAIYWFRRNHDRGVQGNSYKRKMREKMEKGQMQILNKSSQNRSCTSVTGISA